MHLLVFLQMAEYFTMFKKLSRYFIFLVKRGFKTIIKFGE